MALKSWAVWTPSLSKPLNLIVDNFIVITNIFYTLDYIYIISVNYKGIEDKIVRNAFDLKFQINELLKYSLNYIKLKF